MKPGHKLKHRNSNDLIKPILYVSGIKLLKFSIEKFMLECLDNKCSLNLPA